MTGIDRDITQTIYVTGDPTIDWAVHFESAADPEDRLLAAAKGYWHNGGALLLDNLIRQEVGEGFPIKVDGFARREALPDPHTRTTHYSYNELRKDPDRDRPMNEGWRIGRYLGFNQIRKLEQYGRANDPEDASLGGCYWQAWPSPRRR